MIPPFSSSVGSVASPKVAVVGAGYWGKFLIRNFHELGGLGWIVDSRPEVLAAFAVQYPEVVGFPTLEALLAHPQKPDGIVIATPSLTHYALGKQVLEAGIPLYVEKPLATTLADANALVQLADTANLPLMVGHLLLYHPAINRAKQLIDAGVLGQVQYIQSDRLNFNVGRADRNVLWDLAPHDFSVLFYLTNEQPIVNLSATGHCLLGASKDTKIDHIQVQFTFADGIRGYTQASWAYPKKQVQLLIVGSKASLILDDTLPLEERLILVKTTADGTRVTEQIPYLPLEPLRLECQHFLNCLSTGMPSQSAGHTNGLLVVEYLEKVQQLLDSQPS